MLIHTLIFVRENMNVSMNCFKSSYHKSKMIDIWSKKHFFMENTAIVNIVMKYFLRLSYCITAITSQTYTHL